MESQLTLSTKNSVRITEQVSQCVQIIKKKCDEGVPLNKIDEYKALLQKCLATNPNLSEVAAFGLFKLYDKCYFNIQNLLMDLMTCIPLTKITSGIVQLVCCMLTVDKPSQVGLDLNFNLHNPQHPLVTFLEADPHCLEYICNLTRFNSGYGKVNLLLKHNEPLFLYIFCHPTEGKLDFYKIKIWETLIKNNKFEFTTKIIAWMPLNNLNVLMTQELINSLVLYHLGSNNLNAEMLLLMEINILHKLIRNGLEHHGVFENIRLLIQNVKLSESADVILLLLSEICYSASVLGVGEILEICDILIKAESINFIVLQSIKATLLYWMGYPNILSSAINKKAGEIYLYIEKQKNKNTNSKISTSLKKYFYLLYSNSDIYLYYQIHLFIVSLHNKCNRAEILFNFLHGVKEHGMHFVEKIINFISALFITEIDDNVSKLALDIIYQYCSKNEEFNNYLLTLIFYKLSNTKEVTLRFFLLKYISKVTQPNKESTQKISALLKVLSSGSDTLRLFSMQLMYELWEFNNIKWQTHLEEMLNHCVEEEIKCKYEYYLTKASIIGKICEKNSRVHGRTMIPHLSKIINQCSEDHAATTTMCLDTITLLCKDGIIDFKTTWDALSPKLLIDKRCLIIKSFCNFMASIPGVLNKEKHKQLKTTAVKQLWDYSLNSENMEVQKAALNALLQFELEDICLNFPKKYVESKLIVEQVPEKLVPGACWIQFLRDDSSLLDANSYDNSIRGDFLIKLIFNEIDCFTQSVYQVNSSEPSNYNYLPTYSVLRGVAEYLRLEASRKNKPKKSNKNKECLRILSQSYSKPLPPYNWSFLDEMFNFFPNYCLDLASRQVVISGTARRFVEFHIENITKVYQNEEDVMNIYKNLNFLANSIQPIIFKPFFEKTINHSIFLYQNDYAPYLNKIFNYLKNMLTDKTIQNSNKRTVFEILSGCLENINFNKNEKLIEEIYTVVLEFPVEYLVEITTLSSIEQTNFSKKLDYYENIVDYPEYDKYKKNVKLRCMIALHITTNPLNWLNDILNIGNYNISLYRYKEKQFIKVFQNIKDRKECSRWCMEIFGRTEAIIAESRDVFDVVSYIKTTINAMGIFSGLNIFFENPDFNSMFPYAVAILFSLKEWSNYCGQVLEYFYYFNQNLLTKELRQYANLFGQAIQALKEHKEFKNNAWMKFLNAKIEIEADETEIVI